MNGKRKWSNVPGTCCGEIEIEFTSSGYYDPGKTMGLPENCYRPECEDERTVESVTITVGRRAWTLDPKKPAEKAMIAEIEGQFREQIDDEEIDDSDGPEPDWDAIREQREEAKAALRHPED